MFMMLTECLVPTPDLGVYKIYLYHIKDLIQRITSSRLKYTLYFWKLIALPAVSGAQLEHDQVYVTATDRLLAWPRLAASILHLVLQNMDLTSKIGAT